MFEEIGGVRYRRLVPRWALGAVFGVVALLLFFAIASGIPNGPFSAAPKPDGGICPIGWIPGMRVATGGDLEPDGTCQRFNPGP